ncbi:MAG: hypothetical protein CMJ48_02890 [Planctomycetaceae bacterium]|nr:hypothetical protein [Planctomycetaceae bacterium]
MFRLAFAASLILLLWAASFCTDTAHTAVGYTIVTRNGLQHELPSGPVVTAAHETIDSILAERDVPIEIQVVRRPPPE